MQRFSGCLREVVVYENQQTGALPRRGPNPSTLWEIIYCMCTISKLHTHIVPYCHRERWSFKGGSDCREKRENFGVYGRYLLKRGGHTGPFDCSKIEIRNILSLLATNPPPSPLPHQQKMQLRMKHHGLLVSS